MDYDPRETTYRDLLDVAFRSHDHTRQPRKRQYHHLVLTTGDQRAVVEEYLAERDLDTEGVATRVEPLDRVTVAEDDHQKHSLRSGGIPDALAGYDDRELRESSAAAKLNGRAGGHDFPDCDLRAAVERTTGR